MTGGKFLVQRLSGPAAEMTMRSGRADAGRRCQLNTGSDSACGKLNWRNISSVAHVSLARDAECGCSAAVGGVVALGDKTDSGIAGFAAILASQTPCAESPMSPLFRAPMPSSRRVGGSGVAEDATIVAQVCAPAEAIRIITCGARREMLSAC